MLINLWYVAEWSETVKDKPVFVKMLGQNFVLFRDSAGKVHCLSDICLHRGGALSGGSVSGDCIACPYHGWQYNAEGRVTFVPSEGREFAISERARIDSYPTEERYGMVWVFLGDAPEEERFPIPDFQEYDDPKWRRITDEWHWKADAARVVENGIDLAHASFVHPVFGSPETAEANHITKIERGDCWGYSENLQYPPQFKDGPLRKRMRRDKQPTVTKPAYHLSGMLARIQIDINKKMSILMFDCNTPVDENHTRTFATQLRTFFKYKMFDKGSRERLLNIFRQDTVIVERTAPAYLPDDLSNEMSVTDDRFMNGFRMARRKCIEEKGWKIDLAAMRSMQPKQAMAIPSPMRRRFPDLDWVLHSVPLVKPLRQ